MLKRYTFWLAAVAVGVLLAHGAIRYADAQAPGVAPLAGADFPQHVTAGVGMEITCDTTIDKSSEFKPQTTSRAKAWEVGCMRLVNESAANEINIYCTGHSDTASAAHGLSTTKPVARLYPKGVAGDTLDTCPYSLNPFRECREYHFIAATATVVYVEARPAYGAK